MCNSYFVWNTTYTTKKFDRSSIQKLRCPFSRTNTGRSITYAQKKNNLFWSDILNAEYADN